MLGFCVCVWKATISFTGREKGAFVEGWDMRTYPRSGFRSGGTFECTLVPVPGGTSAKTTFLENHPSVNPPEALIFLSLPFWKKQGKTHPKKQGFFLYAEPQKSLRKKGKTLKKARKFLATKKARKSKNARKGRSGNF